MIMYYKMALSRVLYNSEELTLTKTRLSRLERKEMTLLLRPLEGCALYHHIRRRTFAKYCKYQLFLKL